MIKKILGIIAVFLVFNTARAEDYPQYLDESDVYYQKGMDYFRANDISDAITSLKKALDLAPDRTITRTNLAVCYINRGTYFLNRLSQYENAANDYRNAIYYIKYDDYKATSGLADQNLYIAESNLNNAVKALGIDSRLKAAKTLRGQGKFREAIVEYQEALKNSNDAEANIAIGDVYTVLGKSKIAVDYYKNALLINSNKPEVRLKYARALQDSGNSEQAVKEFNVALTQSKNDQKPEILKNLEDIWIDKIKADPRDATAHMNLGVVLQKKGDLDGAMREYKIAETIDPNDITTRLNLGTLYQAQKDYVTALRAYDTILQAKPDHILAHYYRGTALKELGRLDEAIQEFQFVLRKDVQNTMAKDALFETVLLFPDKNHVLNTLSAFAASNPTDPVAQYKFAYYLHSSERLDEALEYYKRTINADSKYIDAYLNIAAIYKNKNQPELAITTLQQAQKAIPNNPKIAEMIAEIDSDAATTRYQNALKMHTDGKYTEAIEEYKKIIAISEPDADLYVNLGAAYFQNKQFDKALNAYKKALSTDPKNENAKQGIAYSRKQMNSDLVDKGAKEYNEGNYKESLLSLNTALINNSSNPDAYYQRGMTYDALGKYQLAIPDYKQAVKYDPTNTMAYYALAIDYDQVKNYVEAKKWYREFLAKAQSQDDEYVKYSKKRLSQL